MVRRFVVKIGSSVLTDERGRLLAARVGSLAEQVAACARAHRQPLIVSSGAIACGMARLGLTKRPTALAQLQACAAIGQSELMHLYTVVFNRHRMTVAQVLLTQDDLAGRERFRNAKQTVLTLLHRRVIPVINENDTVSIEEITFGDNDHLAARVAVALDADLLIILSDVEGLLDRGRVVGRVKSLAAASRVVVHRAKGRTTKGGMASKLEAARLVGHHGIPMVIANGAHPGVVTDVVAGRPVGTLFVPPHQRGR